jgi:hypothetical protein
MEQKIKEINENNSVENNVIAQNLSKTIGKSDEITVILKILNLSGFVLENMAILNGLSIPRDLLLSNEKYEIVSDYLEKLKKLKKYSSSTLTSLHDGAMKKQKWPLLNLVRQILKVENYRMVPFRKTAGKDKNGKKKYVRFFLIERMKIVEEKDFEKKSI